MNNRKARLFAHGWLALLFLCLTLVASESMAKAESSVDTAILDKSSKAFVNVVKNAKPAVVHIKVEKTSKSAYPGGQSPEEMLNEQFFEQFFGQRFRGRQPRQQQEFKQQV